MVLRICALRRGRELLSVRRHELSRRRHSGRCGVRACCCCDVAESQPRAGSTPGRVGRAGHRRRARLLARGQDPRVDGRGRRAGGDPPLPLSGGHRFGRRDGAPPPDRRRRARHHEGRGGLHVGAVAGRLGDDDARLARRRSQVLDRLHDLRRARRARRAGRGPAAAARDSRSGGAVSRGQPAPRVPQQAARRPADITAAAQRARADALHPRAAQAPSANAARAIRSRRRPRAAPPARLVRAQDRAGAREQVELPWHSSPTPPPMRVRESRPSSASGTTSAPRSPRWSRGSRSSGRCRSPRPTRPRRSVRDPSSRRVCGSG